MQICQKSKQSLHKCLALSNIQSCVHFGASAGTVSSHVSVRESTPWRPSAVIVGTPNTYLRGRLYVGGGVFQFNLKVIVGYYVSDVILETQNWYLRRSRMWVTWDQDWALFRKLLLYSWNPVRVYNCYLLTKSSTFPLYLFPFCCVKYVCFLCLLFLKPWSIEANEVLFRSHFPRTLFSVGR